MFWGSLDHKEAIINQHNVDWLSDRRRVVRWTAACARRHRIIIRTRTGGCRGRAGERGGARDILHRPVTYNAIRNAASCCNGKNKTFTLPLKPTDHHNWQSWDVRWNFSSLGTNWQNSQTSDKISPESFKVKFKLRTRNWVLTQWATTMRPYQHFYFQRIWVNTSNRGSRGVRLQV